MSNRLPMVAALSASLLLAGCVSSISDNPKTAMGTIIGGAAGGYAGSHVGSGSGRLAATAAGALLGAFLGSEIGASLDRADRMYMQQAEQAAYTAPMGQRVQWSNPQSGHYGSYVATREGVDRSTGAYCREFQQTIVVGGRQEQGYGTACQQPDGSWAIGGR